MNKALLTGLHLTTLIFRHSSELPLCHPAKFFSIATELLQIPHVLYSLDFPVRWQKYSFNH